MLEVTAFWNWLNLVNVIAASQCQETCDTSWGMHPGLDVGFQDLEQMELLGSREMTAMRTLLCPLLLHQTLLLAFLLKRKGGTQGWVGEKHSWGAHKKTTTKPTLRCTWAPAPFCFRSVSKQGHGGNPGVCHLKILPSSWSIHLIWRHNSFLNSSCVGRRTGGFLKATSLQLEKHCRIRLQAGMPGSVFLKAEGGWQCPSGC